jgi:hypothetical protein
MRLIFWLLLTATPVLAAGGDPEQYKNVPPNVREWFRGVRSPHGVPCCDIADGRRVDWRPAGSGYEAFIGGQWRLVPPEVVVYTTNPTGDAVAFYRDYGDKISDPDRYAIRCFVPGPEP